MNQNQTAQRDGFTLVELLVVIAIIGILVALLLPAVQAAREAARRTQCVNNLSQLSKGILNYESTYKGFPPMAQVWTLLECQERYGACTPGQWFDSHGWYSLIGPFIEESAWADTIDFNVSFSHANNLEARRALLKIHSCPSDLGLQRNEWNHVNWARVRTNYVVNAGNTNYGQYDWGSVKFGGAPFRPSKNTKVATITDGLSNTLMMSEVLVVPELDTQTFPAWGGTYSDSTTALGGQVFTGWYPPNSSAQDGLFRIGEYERPEVYYPANDIPIPCLVPCGVAGPGRLPTDKQGDAKQQWITARSHHPGGVNAARCDGSVSFVSENIDEFVWNALSSAAGGEVFNLDQ